MQELHGECIVHLPLDAHDAALVRTCACEWTTPALVVTTPRYVRMAEAIRAGFGDVFPRPTRAALVVGPQKPKGPPSPATLLVHPVGPETFQVRVMLAGADGTRTRMIQGTSGASMGDEERACAIDPADSARQCPKPHKVEEHGVDLRDLGGPPEVPAALHATAPTTLDGFVDWSRIEALVLAVDALLGASLTEQARPLVRELRSIVEDEQGARARVFDLSVERLQRES